MTEIDPHRALRARVLIATGSIIVMALALLPFIWLLIGSITPEPSVLGNAADVPAGGRTVEYWPAHPTLSNYSALFETMPFLTYFRNSLIVSLGTTILSLLVASLGAYGFVRFRFRGRAQILFGLLMAYMIPSVVLLVPLMVIFRQVGLINTYPGLILAECTIAAPFVLLLMINYFSSLPADLEEAAMVDGCSRLGTMVKIVLPLSLPGLVAGGMFAFISTWNDFLYAYILTSSDATKTLPVMIRLFALGEPAVWGVSAAGAVVTTLPVAILFFIFQRLLIGGLAAGAVKG